jgi:hypothetical protein
MAVRLALIGTYLTQMVAVIGLGLKRLKRARAIHGSLNANVGHSCVKQRILRAKLDAMGAYLGEIEDTRRHMIAVSPKMTAIQTALRANTQVIEATHGVRGAPNRMSSRVQENALIVGGTGSKKGETRRGLAPSASFDFG